MANKITFSDGAFLKAMSMELKKCELDQEAREHLIRWIDWKYNRVTKKANGYWKLPAGKKEYLSYLRMLQELLRIGTSGEIIEECINDYVHYLCMSESRCKVVVLLPEKSTWFAIESIYKAMASDERFEVKLVYIPFPQMDKRENIGIEPYLEDGIPVLQYTEYDLSKDNPDIVIYSKHYDPVPFQFNIREVEKIVERVVYVPYKMEISYNEINYDFQDYLHYRAWRHVGYGPIMKQVGGEYGFRNGENIAVWGHPKVDYHRADKMYSIPVEWGNKINGRRVLLWCPDYINPHGSESISTWFDFSEIVFSQMEKHKDIVLLWRPHPLFFESLINNYMTQEDLNRFLAEKTAKENIVLDQSEDCRVAFAISDGMICDGTTFFVEYLLTGKPLMLTTKKLESIYYGEKLRGSISIGESVEDIEKFINDFAVGRDSKREARRELQQNIFFFPEGKSVGENIADNILTDIKKEEMALVKRLIHYVEKEGGVS